MIVLCEQSLPSGRCEIELMPPSSPLLLHESGSAPVLGWLAGDFRAHTVRSLRTVLGSGAVVDSPLSLHGHLEVALAPVVLQSVEASTVAPPNRISARVEEDGPRRRSMS